jgi:hypothetical protein
MLYGAFRLFRSRAISGLVNAAPSLIPAAERFAECLHNNKIRPFGDPFRKAGAIMCKVDIGFVQNYDTIPRGMLQYLCKSDFEIRFAVGLPESICKRS